MSDYLQFSMALLGLLGLLGVYLYDQRLNRYLSFGMLALGVFGLLGLEAISVARDLVKEVGDVEVRATVELR